MTTINLDYFACGNRNLVGKENGERAREQYDLDELDRSDDLVEIDVSDNIIALSSSFIDGMFFDSVRYFDGAEGFHKHYKFNTSDIATLSHIMHGIARCVLKCRQAVTESEIASLDVKPSWFVKLIRKIKESRNG
jgi:hypothetical protein